MLDEPTSQLDPKSAEDVLNALVRLNQDLGLMILLAEHRLERVLAFVDRMVYVNANGSSALVDEPRRVLEQIEAGPPLVKLGKRLGWSPLPLTIKEGMRFSRVTAADAAALPALPTVSSAPVLAQEPPFLSVRDLAFNYRDRPVLKQIALEVRPGEIVALMGRNGAGKTTLLRSLVGLARPLKGQIRVAGQDTRDMDTADICQNVAYLPQDPNALLFADTVAEELAITLRNHGRAADEPAAEAQIHQTLARLRLEDKATAYPRDLSVGERQRVALGAVTVTQPGALLLDEPTRGLDYAAKAILVEMIQEWSDAGAAVVVVTHDVEFAAALAHRVVLMSQGEIIADGPPAQVLGASPLFAPQVARLFPNRGWLTPADALAGLGAI